MRRRRQHGLLALAVLALLALASVRRPGQAVFTYATHERRVWDGDCQCPSPVLAGETLFFCGGNVWDRRERLVAIDLRSGRERWRRERPQRCGPLTVIGQVLYTWDGKALRATSIDGTELWARDDVVGLPFEVDGRVYVSSRKPAVEIVDPRDGTQLGELPIPELPDATPLRDGDTLHYGTRSGTLVSVNLSTGAAQVSQRARRILGPLAKHGSVVIFDTEQVEGFALMAVELHEGTVRWTVDTKTLSLATPVIAGDRVYFGADRLYAVQLETGAVQTYDLAGGPVGTPVVHDGLLYVPGGRLLHAVDPASGTARPRFEARAWLNAPPTRAPVFHDGVVYVGSLDCNVYGVPVDARIAGDATAPDAGR